MRFVLVMMLAVLSVDATEEIRKPTLTLGTNVLREVVIIRRSTTEVLIRYDGGITKASISEVPGLPAEWIEKAQEVAKAEEKERDEAVAKREELERLQVEAARADRFRVIDPPPPTVESDTDRLARHSEEMGMGLFWSVVIFGAYLAPALVARIRKHRNTNAICVLNLFMGWTLIGWVAALVWAMTNERQPQ